MKKNILTKILLGLMIVLLAFSIVACKPKTPISEEPPEEKKGLENIATMSQIGSLLTKVNHYITTLNAVEDELHVDVAFDASFQPDAAVDSAIEMKIQLKANLYSEDPATPALEADDNEVQVIVELNDGSNQKMELYLLDNNIYVSQASATTFTATSGDMAFTKLDGTEISNLLSGIVDSISAFTIKADLAKMATTVSGFGAIVDGIIEEAQALTFETTEEAYVLTVVTKGLGVALGTLVGDLVNLDPAQAETTTKPIDLSEMSDLVYFVLDFLFGVDSIEALADPKLDTSNFPEISISALKSSNNDINGLVFNYKGDLDKATETSKKEGLSIAVEGDIFVNEDVAITFDAEDAEEAVLEATITIDLGLKDLFLEATIIADPDFDDNSTTYPTAFLTARDKEDAVIANLDAVYDGHTLYFDLAGLYTVLDPEFVVPANTMYKVNYEFFHADALAPSAAQNADEATPEAPAFVVTDDILGAILGKIPSLIQLVLNVLIEQALDVKVSDILDLADGLLFVPGTYDSDKKEWPVSTTKYTEAKMITDLEELLAGFYEGTDEEIDTNAEKATEVIELFTGAEGVTVGSIINSEATSEEVSIFFGLMEEGLGLELDINRGTSDIVYISIELDIISRSTYEAAYTTASGKDYTNAINLMSDAEGGNIYIKTPDDPETLEVDETVKGYVIVDQLMELLELYKGTAVA